MKLEYTPSCKRFPDFYITLADRLCNSSASKNKTVFIAIARDDVRGDRRRDSAPRKEEGYEHMGANPIL
jgi:hypothetical protein